MCDNLVGVSVIGDADGGYLIAAVCISIVLWRENAGSQAGRVTGAAGPRAQSRHEQHVGKQLARLKHGVLFASGWLY